MNIAPAIITLAHIHKTYRLYGSPFQQMLGHLGFGNKNVPTKHALFDISLTVHKGERVGIIGHNGSGKTTLLRSICGHTKPTAGAITVHGSIQALMQRGYGFNDHLSGLENIRNAMVYNGLSKVATEAAEKDIVDFVELGEFLYHPVKTYSLGMRARLEFAAASAIRPSVLVIDEVLGAGDGYFVRKCAARMRSLMENTTLLLVSHSLEQVKEYCERVIWLDAGMIREDGPTNDVLAHYRNHMNARSFVLRNEVETTTQTTFTSQASLHQKLLQSFHIVQQVGAIHRFAFQCHEGHALVTQTGKPLSFTLDISVPLSQRLQPLVLGVTEHGGFAFELELSAARSEGNHSITASSMRCEIGVGDYVLFPALRDASGTIVALGDRPLTLSMAAANWSDSPLVHFDAQWQASDTQLESKISAWV